tara:strand:- start:5474 stop:5713 length:240 start_codon:yes stop_codon:yes gene_type:complete
MTVRELIEQLEQCDPDRIVVIARDAEGNGFSKLSFIDGFNVQFDGDTVGLERLDAAAIASGYSQHDVLDRGAPCVTLFP